MEFEIKTKPRSDREAAIQKNCETATRTYRLDDFKGDAVDLKVIKLDIGLPIYRMANCRTYSEQQDIISRKNLI